MSENIGSKLPPPLRFALGNIAEHQHANAALLISLDADGFPRVAILSETEVACPDESGLRIRLHGQSQSAANLRERCCATLWCVLDAAAYSVRMTLVSAAGVPADPQSSTFELKVREILRDFETAAPLVSGPTYKRL